jgi:hypothetical protein
MEHSTASVGMLARREKEMETRFIDGGEYVDRQTYIQTRDENSALRERIAELEKWKQWADEDAIQRNQENQRLRTKLEAAEAEVENLKAIIRGDGGTKKVNLDEREL